MQPPVMWQGDVAGWNTSQPIFTVEPNQTDFTDLVSFNLQAVDRKTLHEKATLTSFSGYLAVYNNLYIITNAGGEPLTLRTRLLKAPTAQPFTQISAVLAKQGTYYGTLSNDTQIGDTLLEIDNPSLFVSGSSALIGKEMVGVLAKSGSVLVTTPMREPHPIGQRVYSQPVCITNEKVVSWQTQSLELKPGEKAYLTFLVRGEESASYTSQTFPLEFAFEVISY